MFHAMRLLLVTIIQDEVSCFAMQTMITSQQASHFARFGWVEFERFLPPEECQSIQSMIYQTLAHRLKTDVLKLNRFDTKHILAHTRDLWREQPILRQLACSRRICRPAVALIQKNPLLLVCDQWIPPLTVLSPPRLSEHLGFQGLLCGALLILDGADAGNIRFFHPERLPITSESQLLIAYGSLQTVYIYNPRDFAQSFLKQLGYSFGDRLKTDTHPLCKAEIR
jgi:hypothetical protein